MKRIGLLSLVVFISVALVSEIVARDFSSKPALTIIKKSRVQTFRDGNSQALPSLFSSSEEDKGWGFGAEPLFHSPLGACLGALVSLSEWDFPRHTLAHRYLFLPPPA
ncbi:hypothetical protein ACE5IS_10840 [Leptospira wolffii]|uniref:Uncharacterized protein n=1 Tax=Leptospira wolffii TaxID=409998 RepID=A0ABV5BPE5_9LEPT|nr:hypothetical protein [Leptospira wolffii]TGL47418.1 hypothetical protein EHQ61_14980 [Leptospira wolffii]